MQCMIWIIIISLSLSSCSTVMSLMSITIITGRVSTAVISPEPLEKKFIIMSPNDMSLTERNINSVVEQKMFKSGYYKASSAKDANVAVLYRYSIGEGKTHLNITSSPDFVFGGQKISSSSRTIYPCFFEVIIVDLEKSRKSGKFEVIWQGEVNSSVSSTNISWLGQTFLEVLFENYGKTVTNKEFTRVSVQ